MPTTTTNLGLTKPADGDTGWGATVNTNMDLIDAALSGLAADAITLDDSGGVVPLSTGTTNGAKLGTSTAQKLGLWGATPVVQQAHADQAAAASQTQDTLTDASGGSVSTTLASISDTATKNAVASLNAQLDKVKADVAAVRTLVNRLRTDLVTIGVIKGSS